MHVRKFADDIDPATARDIRIRRFAFSAEHKFFVVEVGIPQVVIDRLRSPDWDRVTYAAKERAAEYVRHWRAQGAPLDELKKVEAAVAQFLCQMIYGQFADAQIVAGNPAWEVPKTLQKHTM